MKATWRPDHGAYIYTTIRSTDFAELKALHEELLPVHYSDKFYEEACQGFGLHKAPLFSIIVRKANTEEMMGFLLAQFIDADKCEDSEILVTRYGQPITNESDYSVMYILTLGCKEECRRLGLASDMVRSCLEHARENESCGAVYLHVADFNDAARRFYEKNLFSVYRTMYSFYIINEVAYTAYLYVYYVNGFAGTPETSFLHKGSFTVHLQQFRVPV